VARTTRACRAATAPAPRPADLSTQPAARGDPPARAVTRVDRARASRAAPVRRRAALTRRARPQIALQKHFKAKRDHVLARLDALGLHVSIPPTSTFYIWLDLAPLPAPLNNGLTFFEEMLKEKAIVVPGVFFDINVRARAMRWGGVDVELTCARSRRTAATCSTRRATTSCASRSGPRSRTSTRVRPPAGGGAARIRS
jgi:hypothetical protein